MGYLTSWLAAYCSQFNGMFIPHISGMYVYILPRNKMGFYEAYQLSARSVYVMFWIYPHAPLSSYWKYGYVCLYCMLFPLIASYVDSHMPTFVGYVGPLCFKPFGLYHVDLVRTWWSDVAPFEKKRIKTKSQSSNSLKKTRLISYPTRLHSGKLTLQWKFHHL